MRDLGIPAYSKAIFKWRSCKRCFLLGGDCTMMKIPWASTLLKVNNIGVNMFLFRHIQKSFIRHDYKVCGFCCSGKGVGILRLKNNEERNKNNFIGIIDDERVVEFHK